MYYLWGLMTGVEGFFFILSVMLNDKGVVLTDGSEYNLGLL